MKFDELPHDDTLEKGIFGIILFMPDRFSEVVDMLIPSDFYVTSHQQIWQAMTDLFKEGKAIDFPNLRMQLKKQDVEPTLALNVLSEALTDDIRDYHLKDFVKEVKNKSLLRQIVRMGKSHVYTAQIDNTQAAELLTTMEKDLLSIADKSKEAEAIDAAGIVTAVEADIEKGIKDGWNGFKTGFRKLDDATGGFLPSQVWIVGAYTGVGKTFLILQFLLNVLRDGGRVALFSTEMDKKLNILRLIGNIAELGTIKMMKNALVDEEVKRMKAAQAELKNYGDKLIIYDNVYTVEEIRMKIKKLQLSGGVNVVAIDYIQNLRGGDNIYERMSTAATELFRMAQELKVTVIIGSQVSQEAAGYKSKEAIEFKGAGEIAAVSDVALWLKRGEGGEREILMRKVRHGIPGKVFSRLEFPSGRFIDTDGAAEEAHDRTDIKGQL